MRDRKSPNRILALNACLKEKQCLKTGFDIFSYFLVLVKVLVFTEMQISVVLDGQVCVWQGWGQTTWARLGL